MAEEYLMIRVHADHDNPDARNALAQCSDRLKGNGVGGRGIEQHNVGLDVRNLRNNAGFEANGSDYIDVAFPTQDPPQGFTQQPIFGY
jgi:hypothetical protein